MRDFEVILRTPWGGPWRAFREPSAVLTAWRPDEVRPCLDAIDRAVRDDGVYAAGFVTYEAASGFGLPARSAPPAGLPLVAFGVFPSGHVTFQGRPRPAGTCQVGPWTPSVTHDEYLQAVRQIKASIEAGNTYQINYTFRLRAPWSGDPLALLADLHAAQLGQWGAFASTGRHAICSASPELFFVWNDGRLECRPMKGTARRGLWTADDLARGEALRHSAKNRAENVMIVDMVRNDMGRVAQVGSVEVASMFDVERYPRQWQMTSTVVADAPGVHAPAFFEALFPSGSVTGAPKHSSMQIIRDLECSPRGIYTGAIGYFSPRGRGHFNVAIRTVMLDRETGQAEFGVGSGVVWDSVDRDEYDECLLKASILVEPPRAFRLLETIGYSFQGGFALLDRHLERMQASAGYFGFEFDADEARRLLSRAVVDLLGASRVRLLLARDGSIVCEAVDLGQAPAAPLRAALATSPIDPLDAFLYHKTTRRDVYDEARASRPDADAVILWNPAGEVTEGTEANLVALIDGRKVTPPITCGLLAGTLRAELLASGEIAEARITIAALRDAEHVWLINSVRGWMDVGPEVDG
ncbi:MAG: aminodeoxychorismate synthase component I [Acidobacteria bacterium]|nr:aminodeoxychorismate synthase component I [Acidobacteriota bacterium]